MPKPSNSSSEESYAIALKLLDLLNDDSIVAKLRKALHPKDIAEKIDILNTCIEQLTKQIQAKDSKIAQLEEKVNALEESADKLEQYTRRPNLTFHSIAERNEGENTDIIVLDIINDKLKTTPPLAREDITRSHRLGAKRATESRPFIVRFNTERKRDNVFHNRFNMKDYNNKIAMHGSSLTKI